jgi:hypothetical protein
MAMTADDDAQPEVAGLIDPPFGRGVEAWRMFKSEMEKQPQGSDVQDFIEEADREIKALERGRALEGPHRLKPKGPMGVWRPLSRAGQSGCSDARVHRFVLLV